MQEKWTFRRGQPNLTLSPETEKETQLTKVEVRLLRATLDEHIALDPRIKLQIASAKVTERIFTNVGFFISVVIPSEVPAADPAILSCGAGCATIGFRSSKKGLPLNSHTLSKDGRLECLEAVILDDEPWPPRVCWQLLTSPPSDVWINTSKERDWAKGPLDL